MVKATDFDPRRMIQDRDDFLTSSDALTASGLKLQSVLHRQRVGAARTRLRRAMERDASADDVAELRANLEVREQRLAVVDDQFAAADIVRPAPNADQAKLFGQITGDAGIPPYTAALIGPGTKLAASAGVEKNGAFILAADGSFDEVRLQISDAKQQTLFRDPVPFSIDAGQVVTRQVSIADPVKPPAPPPVELTMPDLSGQTEAAACAILFRLGVRDIDVSKRPHDGPAGVVIDQAPEAGALLDVEGGAKIVISEPKDPDPEKVPMPNFIGRDIQEARRQAKTLGIKLSERSRRDDAPKGKVIAQEPAAETELHPPLQASVVVSSGRPEPDKVTVPALEGLKASEAKAKAEELGFKVAFRTVTRDGTSNVVIDQDPKAGKQVTLPATLTLTINKRRTIAAAEAGSFADRFVATMAKDSRLRKIGLTKEEAAGLARKLRLADQEDAQAVIKLDNAALRDKTGVKTLTQARTLRSVMRVALRRMG